ncbi:Nucleotidyl transferase AbiEii toxin, Type IV TA system [Micromonospora citrea]|uniref:Nucleotidyl transferase AbiEii toxin, Type IV TA system n=1 Tax=Micromonospora citrea TaxID=47855 RepID=A0A1C6VWX8_9ACTN|nr:nucleotidyl transferase AbiEii/AbiGii toxin family protein [Micromonospora citrea]SCL70861.1 Nucleotidyl transferase AbiEii toxin, Type IV TA system [Micromonospora citrea]
MRHVLTAVAASDWGRHLVLRGSVTMAAWVGDAAREPGDLDFVVTPHTITSDSADARALLDEIRTAVRATPGAGLRPDAITESAIWTYERADGRRPVIPFSAPQAPDGHVQVDITVDQALVRQLMRPELGAEADTFTAETVLSRQVDWTNCTDEYPGVTGTAEQWSRRLALALDRAWA